jgi:hypothetical protein
MTRLETPVAYLVYNRPQHVERTFETIRSAQPRILFLIADGPKADSETDSAKCHEVRRVLENIDWPCKVFRNYAEKNLGLKARVSSGLDWVFSQVDRAIILEDDCLPHPDFFKFCAELLKRYESDNRIWTITGNNFQNGTRRGESSYYFSKYPHCWGWATWARAWKNYQGDIPFWINWKISNDWRLINSNSLEMKYWTEIFQRVYDGMSNSWAYPWMACVWRQKGLTATPNVNLVTNIGCGLEGTNTISDIQIDGAPIRALGEISHPRHIYQNKLADIQVFQTVFSCEPWFRQAINDKASKRFARRIKNDLAWWIKNWKSRLP